MFWNVARKNGKIWINKNVMWNMNVGWTMQPPNSNAICFYVPPSQVNVGKKTVRKHFGGFLVKCQCAHPCFFLKIWLCTGSIAALLQLPLSSGKSCWGLLFRKECKVIIHMSDSEDNQHKAFIHLHSEVWKSTRSVKKQTMFTPKNIKKCINKRAMK